MDAELQAQLPLTETTFFILLALAAEPRHGYAIMKDVTVLSDGRMQLGTGTLYGALKRLLDQDWIARLDNEENDGGGRERKSYRLTETGQRILAAEIERLRTLLAAAQNQPLWEGT